MGRKIWVFSELFGSFSLNMRRLLVVNNLDHVQRKFQNVPSLSEMGLGCHMVGAVWEILQMLTLFCIEVTDISVNLPQVFEHTETTQDSFKLKLTSVWGSSGVVHACWSITKLRVQEKEKNWKWLQWIWPHIWDQAFCCAFKKKGNINLKLLQCLCSTIHLIYL